MTEGQGNGGSTNREHLWIGIGLFAVAALVAALKYSDTEPVATAIGAVFGALLIGPILVGIVRLIWARGNAARAFEPGDFIALRGRHS